MPMYLIFALVGLVAVVLLVRSIAVQRQRTQARKAALEQLGFRPCPEQKGWLEETVASIENNRGFRYEVREPRRLAGEQAIYYYVKKRHSDEERVPMVEEEILFPLKRPTKGSLALTVKPSSLAPGLATRMMGAVATGPWDAQPDDLQRLDLPPDLKDTNLVGAMGPPGAKLYELVDASTLSVVQGLGDAGGLFVRFRDSWCSVSSTGWEIPFRLDEIVARIRPLL
ncbi:MAG: hypothetical protein ACRD88_09975 [Terriglobia bacterium]